MTREEAIKDIQDNILPVVGGKSLQMAIEALKAQESKQDADDTISRKAAIKAIDVKNVNKGIISALQSIIEELPSAQPETHEKRTETHACDSISRQAVEHLDWFTKLYCRDKSITDDLAFRCEQCEFEMPDGRCLVKAMASKLCPDYKDFGAMGDL